MRYRRQETFRYVLPHPHTIPFRLVWAEKELHEGEGMLLNVSSGGLKLRSDYLFPLSGELKVHLELDLDPTTQPINVIGHVRHRSQIGSMNDYGIQLETTPDQAQQLVTMIKSYARLHK